MRKWVLSKRLVDSRAALNGISIPAVNDAAGFSTGSGYIYRLFGRDNIELRQVNRIANALGCTPGELLEEVEESEGVST